MKESTLRELAAMPPGEAFVACAEDPSLLDAILEHTIMAISEACDLRGQLTKAEERLTAFLAWLDEVIEAARKDDAGITRTALERVKARLVG